ncbi:MAG: hypothetical protein HY674_19535 [Chloroflexi bacterium]|nr:hypothetical protein [Chloroflexota bacterium]
MLRDIGGVGIYGVISITIFFLFFIGILGWVWRLKRPYLEAMGTLPLESESRRLDTCAPDLDSMETSPLENESPSTDLGDHHHE